MIYLPSIIARKKAAVGGAFDFTTGLQHFWNLDGGTDGDTAAYGGVDLTEQGACSGASTGGPNASYGYRTCDDTGNANFVTASNIMDAHVNGIIIACWFKTSTTGKYLWGHNATNGFSEGVMFSTPAYFRTTFDSTAYNTAALDLADGAWHSIVASSSSVTGTASGDETFIDGVSVKTGTSGFENGAAVLYVGAGRTGAIEWTGDIASFGVWDRSCVGDGDAFADAWHNGGSNLHYADF